MNFNNIGGENVGVCGPSTEDRIKMLKEEINNTKKVTDSLEELATHSEYILQELGFM